MTPVATDAPRSTSAETQAEGSAQRLFDGDGLTLEDVVLGAWEDLVAGDRAECLVCGGPMTMLAGCEGCGSELS